MSALLTALSFAPVAATMAFFAVTAFLSPSPAAATARECETVDLFGELS